MKLKKCKSCKLYTLKDFCKNCKEKTADAHYKFVRVKSDNKLIKLNNR